MAKDSKTALKEARELLKQKEYAVTVKICKKILKEDKRNYNALVLMGAAMREIEDSQNDVPTVLKKATDIQPDNPLAWHGLLVHFEVQPDTKETWAELVPIYNKFLQLESDPSKVSQYLKNLSIILLKLNDEGALTKTISRLIELRKTGGLEKELMKQVNEALVTLLTQYPKLFAAYDEMLEQILNCIIEDEDCANKHEYYKKYLKHLYRTEKYDQLLSEAVKMHKIFTQDIYPLEWLCRVYAETSITHGKCEKIDISCFYETLLDHDPESVLAYFAKAAHLYDTGNLIDARNILSHLVNAKPKWFHAWLLLCKIDILLYCWEDAESAALQALRLTPEGDPHNLHTVINLLLLEALIKSSNPLKWKKAEMRFDELCDNSIKSSVLRAHLYIQLNNPQARDLIEILKNESTINIEATVLHAMLLLQEKHLEEAADVLGSILESSQAWLTLGKVHWEMADYGHSLMAFLKGIQADSNNWECLVYLGRYHQEHTKDYERARKCFQKALQINPNSEQAGIGLSLVHRYLKNSDANSQFLNQLTSQGKGPKWAFLQLGLQNLDQGNATEAVPILRNAVKTDPTDSNCWECLADAYLARGAHLSALKSYERALQLNPESIYSMTQLAHIKLLVGQLASARADFSSILLKSEDNVVALKGLAESCFKLGKEHFASQLLARARDDFQESLDSLTKVILLKKDLLCIWKLLGDVFYHVAILPKKYCYLLVVPELMSSESRENMTVAQTEIFLLSIRCYSRALNMSKSSSFLWHDLARCYLAQILLDNSVEREKIASKCFASAKEAVKIDPSSWAHWNLLGVICMLNYFKNYALAQHCFVMALDRESNPISWTNLGTLYLLLGEPYRANEAFSWAQKTDPAYINCWIGQAFLAETLSKKDAMDLFRHATQLGYHHEAATGYTHWVISTIRDPEARKDSLCAYVIEKMHALAVASDAINWYTVHSPNDAYALNAYGLLLERQNLYKTAADKFSAALKNVQDPKQKDAISINVARLMLHLGRYEDAVKICLSIKEASFASQIQLALSLFKAEHFKESYEAYEAALHWLADSETDKAHVLCAMAAMAYMFQESNDAKTLLFQSVSIKPPIVSSLLALAALGMLDGDKNLTQLVLKELKSQDNHPEYKHHVAKMMAYSYLIQNDMEGASRLMCKYVHRYPDSPELWTYLARILLIMSDLAFNKCVDKALFLGRNESSEQIAKITCMSSLSKLITLSYTEGLRSVLNTVHSFPSAVDSWSNLVAALLPRWSKISQSNAHWLMVLASRVRNNLICSRSMEQWLLKNEKQANDIAYV
ncbi:hypothetical protein QAD02_017348 [Eretmocerus hayati]|uniref:Uncharacterized protein n=1 Tax=Eretmocerus hayati TaxID=131215 RepID=A0ACC2PEX6_9HYME|nr:hypothetical protein QAD02_017348 [Eretmocerus hayati]